MSTSQRQALKDWFFNNFDNPYLDRDSKLALIDSTGLTGTQISNWFMNVRKRVLKPAVAAVGRDKKQELLNLVRIRMEEDIVILGKGSVEEEKKDGKQCKSPQSSVYTDSKSKKLVSIEIG